MPGEHSAHVGWLTGVCQGIQVCVRGAAPGRGLAHSSTDGQRGVTGQGGGGAADAWIPKCESHYF